MCMWSSFEGRLVDISGCLQLSDDISIRFRVSSSLSFHSLMLSWLQRINPRSKNILMWMSALPLFETLRLEIQLFSYIHIIYDIYIITSSLSAAASLESQLINSLIFGAVFDAWAGTVGAAYKMKDPHYCHQIVFQFYSKFQRNN